MMRTTNRTRRGAIVPLTALCMVGLLGMVALCIDLSLLALGKTQSQNAADMSAMAAARTLDGIAGTNNNIAQAFVNGKNAAAAATVLGLAPNADVRIGLLYYDTSTTPPAFRSSNLTVEGGTYTPPTGHNWGLAETRVTATVNFAFAKIFGLASMPVEATAQAIHRPRDVALVMDFSGSMAFDSFLVRPKTGSTSNPPYSSLNNDPRVPRFGHYDPDTAANVNATDPPFAKAGLVNSEQGTFAGDYVRTDTQEIFKVGNQTYTTTAGNPIVEDFYTVDGTGGMIRAFAGSAARVPVTAFDGDNYPTAIPNWMGSLGDKPRFVNTTPVVSQWPTAGTVTYTAGTTFLKTMYEFARPVVTSTTPAATPTVAWTVQQPAFENVDADSIHGAAPAGFSYGPGHYGKSFFAWPPVPDTTANAEVPAATTATNETIRDWRQRFFWAYRTGTPATTKKRLDDNNILYQSNGAPRRRTSSFTDAAGVAWRWEPNYEAILYWLKNTGPNPFPDNVRCGRILYFDSIPDTVANAGTNMDQLFWREYIDWVVAFDGWEDSGTHGMAILSGYGNDFSWATSSAPAAIRAKPNSTWQPIGRIYQNYASGLAANSPIRVKTTADSDVAANMLNWVPPVGTRVRFNSATTGPIYTVSAVDTNLAIWQLRVDGALTASVSTNQVVFAETPGAYMDYRDNPHRPKHRFWFGPLTFGDFVFGDYDNTWRTWRPGNCHEAPMWVLKTGIQAALQDIERNHPNDWVSMVYFSVPKSSSGDSDQSHRFNRARGPLGKNYGYMANALWYPPSVIQNDGTLLPRTATGGEIRPFTSSFGVNQNYREAPYASGGTCPMWGFTLAYNQFSSNANLQTFDSGQPSGMAGGNGRVGARKLVVFETDGVPNHTAVAGFSNNGVGQSFFTARMPSEYPSVSSLGNMNPTVIRETYRVLRTLADNPTGNTPGSVNAYIDSVTTETIDRATGRPGYSTTTRPVLVHALAFGGLFESTSSLKPQCLGFLQSVQTFGNTQTSPTTALPAYKVITGTSTERIEKLKTAFTIIMQDGVQISLYK